MERVVLLFGVFLLGGTKGFSTGTPVFVETGKDLFLHVNEQVTLGEGGDLTWRINGSTNIVKSDVDKTTIFSLYKGRAEIDRQNYSLRVKNVQQNDSGDYRAQVSGDKVTLVAEYKVTVQDPVSPVQLTVNSSSSCNLTVTCSTVDSNISSTFRCDNQTCFQQGGERSEAKTHPSSISVYVKHDHIICNHSNQVSWKQDKKQIEFFCQTEPATSGVNRIAIGAGAGAGVGAVAVFAAVMTVLFIRYEKKNNCNTEYEVPQNIRPAQTVNETPTEDASGNSPTSTYCLVTFHTGPGESIKTKNTPKPETVYAQVNRAAKTNKNQHTELERTDLIYLQE